MKWFIVYMTFFVSAWAAKDPALELKRVEKLLEEKRRNLLDLEHKEKSFLQAISELDAAIVDLKKLKDQTLARISKLQKEVAQLQTQTDRLNQDIVEKEQQLKHKMQELYVYQNRLQRPLIPSNNLQLFYMQKLIRKDVQTLKTFSQMVQTYLQKKENRHRSILELTAEKASLDKQTQLMQATKKDRQQAISRLEKDKKRLKQAQDELYKRQKSLSALVEKLLKKKKTPSQKPKAQNLQSIYKKGPFSLPVLGGHIQQGFGQKSKSGFSLPSQGLHIRGALGEKVKVAWAGKVAYQGALKGFGRIVIVDHGDEVHTLYAHLDSILVETGAAVKQGEAVGLLGESDSLEGPKLYFEVRKDGIPKDPKLFLK